MTVPVLIAEHVTKTYGDIRAVADVSLSVTEGQVVVLLGPNGSGKTTLIECIEGLRAPDSGSIQLFGIPLRLHDRRPRELGVQLQEEGLPSRITVAEALRLYSAIYAVDQMPPGLLDLLELEPLLRRRFDNLSGGQKRRVALALAFINDPWLAILDEPTSGLDPEGQRVVVELLRDRANAGSGILTTLHDMQIAAQVADRVAVLSRGQLIALGSPAELIDALNYEYCLMVNLTVAGLLGLVDESQIRPNPRGGSNVYGPGDQLAGIRESLRGKAIANLRSCDLSDVALLHEQSAQLGQAR